MKLHLSIVTPTGSIFDGEVKMVTLPGSEGEFGVLPGHADLVSFLAPGVIEVILPDDTKEYVAVNWGYVKVSEEVVDVLADGAVALTGGSESKIAKAIEDAKELIEKAASDKLLYSTIISKIESAGRQKL